MSLAIEDASFNYLRESEPAIEHVNLRLEPGEFTVLTGPSGCGKSTLAKCIVGFIPHATPGRMQGRILVDGLDTRENRMFELSKHVGIVFQNPENQLYCLRVTDEVAFGPENMGLPREEIARRVEDALKLVGLSNLKENFVFTLSGGQKQRLAIACALSFSPKILILDEPTTDIDPLGTREVLEVVQDLSKSDNMTILMIEHKLEQVLDKADRLIVMDRGKIVLDGPPRDVMKEHWKSLMNTGVQVPQAIEISRFLQEKGVKFDQVPLNADEILPGLRGYIEKVGVSTRSRTSIFEDESKAKQNEPLVILDDVWYKYDVGPVILKGVSLEVRPGEIIGMIGPNGAGKSTLVKLLVGLLRPTRGRYTIDKTDASKLSVSELASKIGFLFQNPDHQLFTNRVWDEVAFGSRYWNVSQEEANRRVATALETMDLMRYRDRHPHALSRGERQRLAVATVIVKLPKMMILDEPTTGQDYGRAKALVDLAIGLQRKEGLAALLISHNMRLISEYTERTIVVNSGKIVMDAPTREVFSKKEELNNIGIELPTIPQLFSSLTSYGFPPALTVNEFYQGFSSIMR